MADPGDGREGYTLRGGYTLRDSHQGTDTGTHQVSRSEDDAKSIARDSLKRRAQESGQGVLFQSKRLHTGTASISFDDNPGQDAQATQAPEDGIPIAHGQLMSGTMQLSNPDACLGALAAELLDEIAAYLPRRSLFRLSLMSRYLSFVFLHWLYKRGLSSRMSDQSRRSFIRQIHQRPELAELVKRFHASQGDLEFIDGNGKMMQSVRFLDVALEAAVNIEELGVALNKTKDYHLGYQEQEYRWVKLLSHAAKRIPAAPTLTYSNLKTLRISHAFWVSGWMRLGKLSAILRLPSLEKVALKGFVETKRILDWGCPRGGSNVKQLELKTCFLHSNVVVQLLASCSALTQFSAAYITDDNWEPFSEDDHPKKRWAEHSWRIVSKGLQQHKTSLQVLNLTYNPDPELVSSARRLGYKVQPRNLGSLRDFVALKHINAPMDALLSSRHSPVPLSDSLPPGLESLTLRLDENTKTSETVCIDVLEDFTASRAHSPLQRLLVSIGADIEAVDLQRESRPVQWYQTPGIDITVAWRLTHSFTQTGRLVREVHGDSGVDESDDDRSSDEFESTTSVASEDEDEEYDDNGVDYDDDDDDDDDVDDEEYGDDD